MNSLNQRRRQSLKAMNRLRTSLPKITRAGVLSEGNKLYMEATVAEKPILGYDKLVGVTVSPKSYDDLKMMSNQDLHLAIDENTPFGESFSRLFQRAEMITQRR